MDLDNIESIDPACLLMTLRSSTGVIVGLASNRSSIDDVASMSFNVDIAFCATFSEESLTMSSRSVMPIENPSVKNRPTCIMIFDGEPISKARSAAVLAELAILAAAVAAELA